LIRSATEPQFSERAGKAAADALQTTPEKPHLKNTAIAKKQRSAAEARKATGKEQSAAGNVLRLVTTGLVGVIPMDLEQLDTAGIGANPYFDTTARSHLQRLYRGPQLYAGPRKAYHLDFFLRVARSAVAELEQEGRSVAPAVEVIEYILDQTLPAKLHGGEVWAFLTIILKAVRHEADSVGEAGAADEPIAKKLDFSPAEEADRLLQDFDDQVEVIGQAVHTAVTKHLPAEEQIARMLKELDAAYAAIVQAFPDENSPQRLAMKVQCKQLVGVLKGMPTLLSAPEELYGDFHTPLALELFAEQVQAIRQEAAGASAIDPEALARVVKMVIDLVPAYAAIDKRLRYSDVPAQRTLLRLLCQQVATAVAGMDRGLKWADLPKDLADELQNAMTAMGIGFRRPVARVQPARVAVEPAPLNVPAAALPEVARVLEAPAGSPQEPAVQAQPVAPADNVFASRAARTVVKNDDPVKRVDGIDWSTLALDDEPGEDDPAA
jgi:hypothetical protein